VPDTPSDRGLSDPDSGRQPATGDDRRSAIGGPEAAPAGVTVAATDSTTDGVPDLERWRSVASDTLAAEGIPGGHLDLLFVDPGAMADLKGRYLGQRQPTDVLAFPLDGPDVAAGDDPTVGPPRHLGDVVVCPQVARNQAPAHAGDFRTEVTLLIVHGVLHVLGHDHAEPDETRRMQERERFHLERFGHHHPVEGEHAGR
jgi:probable rRNA maturation factor